MPKLLFISHEASRTGAPILLLRLIRAVKEYSDLDLVVLSKRKGPLLDDFRQLAPTYVWNNNSEKGRFKLFSQLKQWVQLKIILRSIGRVDYIFSNTVANAELVKKFRTPETRLFCYLHELTIIAQVFSNREDMLFFKETSTKVFVPSMAVHSFLVDNYDYSDNKLIRLPYLIPKHEVLRTIEAASSNMFRVAFSGTLDWRKGYDLIVLLIRYVVIELNITDIRFRWIGINRNSLEYRILQEDLKKIGLVSYFESVEITNDIVSSLVECDLFVLPSREDAFPLVVLEAASLMIPTICFSEAGGIPEFVEDDAGICVEYLDVASMAKAIRSLKNDPERRMALGKKAIEKLAPYQDAEGVVSLLLNTIKLD